MRIRTFDWLALTIIIIGAINWGLIGVFGFDLLSLLLGGFGNVVSRILYALVGVAGLYALSLYGKIGENDMDYQNHTA